jgi:hypothetical protein
MQSFTMITDVNLIDFHKTQEMRNGNRESAIRERFYKVKVNSE